MEQDSLVLRVEALLFASNKPLKAADLLSLFEEDTQPTREEMVQAIERLQTFYQDRSISLMETASGFQFKVKADYASGLGRLWEERIPRYSRALLETLAIVAYRQPVTRGDIEAIRGVTVSPSILKTLLDREWIRVIGAREVPGKPVLYATTKSFLDYFSLRSLDQLPTLSMIPMLSDTEIEEQVLLEQTVLPLDDEVLLLESANSDF